MDIEKMQQFVSQVKSMDIPRWTSRKLWLTIGAVGTFIWLFQTTLNVVVWPVTILVGLYLIISYLENRDASKAKLELKKELIKCMCSDGTISPEEADVINRTN